MVQRLTAILFLLLVAVIVGSVWLLASPLSAAAPTPIACPNGQTVFVEGRAPPREPLLIYLGGRAVGGGVADANGAYRLPLRAQERPGAYPVEVRLRATRAIVERFTCFVDVPLGALPTETPTAPFTTAPVAATPPPAVSPRATAPQVTPSPGPPSGTTTATPETTPTLTPTGSTSTPTATPTGPTATVTATTAGFTSTPTRTPVSGSPSPTPSSAIQIIDVVLLDPAFPQDSEEYVQIRNTGTRSINIAGWRLVNASRPDANRPAVAAYVFPSFNFDRDVTIAVFSQAGENDLEIGDFYWGQQGSVWKVGDRAELRDAQNNLIHVFVVQNQ